MPALGMAQETGKLVAWLKAEGDTVTKGEPLMEVETDKATVEIEAAAAGVLTGVVAKVGDEIPVGQTIAWILAAGEALPGEASPVSQPKEGGLREVKESYPASPVARKMAAQHGVDLAKVPPTSGQIKKEDVLAYLEAQKQETVVGEYRKVPASPKARRLGRDLNLDLARLTGTGPAGAILAADVMAAQAGSPDRLKPGVSQPLSPGGAAIQVSTIWGRMAERVSESWKTAPHFYLLREVNASRLVSWRRLANERSEAHITYTDLLVMLLAAALQSHPRVNATWNGDEIILNQDYNIGIATAVEEGLIVPVIHQADKLTLGQIAQRREEVVTRARAGKLRLEDLQGGTFTLSNLGMYGVDVFNAIINPPQAAILAVGRIAERVVPINGQPAVQPMMVLSMSFDHRVVDGAQGAQFLDSLANLIEEPLGLLVEKDRGL